MKRPNIEEYHDQRRYYSALNGNYYYCVHCNKIAWRDSNKEWVKSYCEQTGKTVHLQKAK